MIDAKAEASENPLGRRVRSAQVMKESRANGPTGGLVPEIGVEMNINTRGYPHGYPSFLLSLISFKSIQFHLLHSSHTSYLPPRALLKTINPK